ncbi:hypothetical protein Bbelb_216610 [Branchiostoma belcheri]|nr:hypothetical protein Bbelb_216610 [Branchiostoma belcheri]
MIRLHQRGCSFKRECIKRGYSFKRECIKRGCSFKRECIKRGCSFKRESIKRCCSFKTECASEESLFLADVCGIFISVTGVVLVVVGNTQVDGMPTKLLVLSIVIPLTASFVSAPEVVFMRYLTGLKNVKAYISTTVRMFVIPFTLILDYFFLQKVPNSFHLAGVVLVMVGIVFVSAHTWRKERLKNVKAYISTTVRMFVIPFTLILDYFFLQKVPNSFHLAGVVLVMVGIVFVSAKTWWRERQKERRVELLQTLQFDPD